MAFAYVVLSDIAFATCGDWLDHSWSHKANHSKGGHENDQGNAAKDDHDAPEQAPVSCQGPQCRTPNEVPNPIAPMPSIPSQDDQRVAMANGDEPANPSLSRLLFEGTLILPEAPGTRLDRPPER